MLQKREIFQYFTEKMRRKREQMLNSKADMTMAPRADFDN